MPVVCRWSSYLAERLCCATAAIRIPQIQSVLQMISRTVCTVLFGSFLLAHMAWAQPEDSQYGDVSFPVSCETEAQEQFETGLALLHHMMYGQAESHFSSAAQADESCAMAHWGIAMTQLRPLWAPPTDEEFERGRSAVEKAKTLRAPTEREQQYVDAIAAYYETANGASHEKGVQAWEQAQKTLHEAFPDDVDAAAFYALSHLATAPPDDKTYEHQRRAGVLLEDLREDAPKHPGGFHYLIHAYDNPVLSDRAVQVARGYDKLAPDVPHALHMPSHIFVRLGIWDDVIEWNIRSAEAALRHSPAEYTSLHHVHALDYMVYAYLQRGQDEKATDALSDILKVERYQPHPASAYGIAAAQARLPLERRQWEEAAELPLRVHDTYPWDTFPEHEAITYWARGLGAAKSGDLDAARSAVQTLEDFHENTVEKGVDYWATLVEGRTTTVSAWIAFAEGDHDRALRLMREAADLEDSVDKHPITPSEVLPARELLGDMLLALDMPSEALQAYKASLEISPNRFNSLYGAGRAAETAGQADVAKEYYGTLAEMSESADTARESLNHARKYLAEH